MDLLQFHWWDYNNPYYMDALKYLSDLRDEGLIKHIGLTNFDTEHMQIMIDSGLENCIKPDSIFDYRSKARSENDSILPGA